ncbi:MAG: cell division protein FtsZ, partial [Oscillospiraceae bacterium]|nr:cell division protein FtsZ [Oscillospiraceae bacterium]
VQEAAHPDAHIIFGASIDETMDDELRVVVVATGFEEIPNSAKGLEKKKVATPAPTPASAGIQGIDTATLQADADDAYISLLEVFNRGH